MNRGGNVNELITTCHPINTSNQAVMNTAGERTNMNTMGDRTNVNTTSNRTNVNTTGDRANMSGVAC